MTDLLDRIFMRHKVDYLVYNPQQLVDLLDTQEPTLGAMFSYQTPDSIVPHTKKLELSKISEFINDNFCSEQGYYNTVVHRAHSHSNHLHHYAEISRGRYLLSKGGGETDKKGKPILTARLDFNSPLPISQFHNYSRR